MPELRGMTLVARVRGGALVGALLSLGAAMGCVGATGGQTSAGDAVPAPTRSDAGATTPEAPTVLDASSFDMDVGLTDTAPPAAMDSRGDAAADRPSSPGGVPDAGVTTDAACPATAPAPTGATIELHAPATLASALASSRAGDRIVMHAGSYAREQISKRKFASFVFVEAAAGEAVTIAGASFASSDHLAFRGVTFTATVMLDGSSNFRFDRVTLDGGATEDAALQIHGQGSAGASHDVLVQDSTIRGGGRTVFVLGVFGPSDGWNHHLTFTRDDITCGSHNCFQISGGRDLVIDGNRINGTTTAGVLTAGATRVAITRNRFVGGAGKPPAATQLATPGHEWDNYAGVENMISSGVVIANNVIDGWGVAVQLDAARDVAIVSNTVVDGVGVRFNHRTPTDQAGKVILNGNSDIRVWDDILPSISVAAGEPGPAFEGNNVIWKGGGGGAGLITTAPVFAPSASDSNYALAPGSGGIDAALVNAETPLVDFENRPRGPRPDIGARELGAAPPACR